MSQQFDLIVIGTGAGGATAAYECRAAGWEVAIIDSRPYGGTCALRGCDPKKVLVGAAELIDRQRRMTGNGVSAKNVLLDWPELMAFKRTFTEPVPENREHGFQEAGIATFHGQVQFVDRTTLKIGETHLTGRYVLIASGARPAPLDIPGEEHLTTSTEFLSLEHLPARIVFVGGGYISFEFAHIAARTGSQVTILHRNSSPLENFDADLVASLVQATRDLGVTIRFDWEVTAIESQAVHFIVQASTKTGSQQQVEADLVVHGAGRVPDLDGLALEQADVATDKRGVVVNEYLQSTTNEAVYAAGDAANSGPRLTPVASRESSVVARNLLEGNHVTADLGPVPSVVFTIPSLATVGLTEDAARDQGLQFRTQHENTSSWYSSRRVNAAVSGYKVLVEKGSDRILGAHLLGPNAEEVINLFAMAMRFGLGTKGIKEMIYAYPTSASDIGYMV